MSAITFQSESYLADLILPFVEVFDMGRVESLCRAGRGACEVVEHRIEHRRRARC